MKKKILKAMVFVLTACAVLPAVAALAHFDGDRAQQVNARKEKPVSPIDARKEKPVSPID